MHSTAPLRRPDGSVIQEKANLEYLGALISADGRAESEVSRRIGFAYLDFRALSELWSRSNASRKAKIRFFDSLVISRLLYGLSTLWLVTAQRRRLDSFYARCLRRILHIPAAFISRVPNAVVFDRAAVVSLSKQLLARQLTLFATSARSLASDLRRQFLFSGSTMVLREEVFIRRRGRPRHTWGKKLMEEGCRLFGTRSFEALLGDTSEHARASFKRQVHSLCIGKLRSERPPDPAPGLVGKSLPSGRSRNASGP